MISRSPEQSIFVDTSAFYALLNRDDTFHERAKRHWKTFAENHSTLITHNYILVEMFALTQSRHGLEAVSTFQKKLLGPVNTHWIQPEGHDEALKKHMAKKNRSLSFVDRISLNLIDRLQVPRVFAFDDDFSDQDFELLN